MTTPRILLLEDDPAIARTVIYALERASLQVTHCLLVRDALRQISIGSYDVLVLDVGLPDGSGLDVCRQVRAQGATPVLMLSAHGEEIDRVLGLELGADDYVTKPFSPRELVARVRGLLRRVVPAAAPTEPPSLFTVDTTAQRASLRQQPLDLTRREFGLLAELLRRAVPAVAPAEPPSLFTVDTTAQRASLRQQPLDLTRREFGLLAELLRRPGHIRSREALLNAVWGLDSDSTERTVDTHIKTLRAKLQQADPGREHISTHRGMGYAINLEVNP